MDILLIDANAARRHTNARAHPFIMHAMLFIDQLRGLCSAMYCSLLLQQFAAAVSQAGNKIDRLVNLVS